MLLQRHRSRNFTALLFLICLLFISHVAAQDLPELPSKNDDSSSGTSGTGTATATVTSASTGTNSATAKTTSTNTASSTKSAASSTSTDDTPNGLPKLSQDDYAAPAVPNTANAPFMQKSNLPEGTVFIAVGAFLGFLGVMVLAWRGFMAWSVHQSVKRAANASIAKYDTKDPLLGAKKNGMYMNPGAGSTILSLDQLGGGKKGGAGGNGANSKTNSAHTSLFFSPTAGAGIQNAANRNSGYLPAGYYASGTAAPANGTGMAHIGGGGAGLPMTNLPNGASRRVSSMAPSPPRSPSLPPSRGAESIYNPNASRLSTQGLVGQQSNPSLNSLSVAPQGRAPSAYLEDLFANHPPPQSPRRG